VRRRIDWVAFALLSAFSLTAYAQSTVPAYFGWEIGQIPFFSWVLVAVYSVLGTLWGLNADIKSGEVGKNIVDVLGAVIAGAVAGYLIFCLCEGAQTLAKYRVPYWTEGVLIFFGARNKRLVMDSLSKAFAKWLKKAMGVITG
jgi:hypothetical protein